MKDNRLTVLASISASLVFLHNICGQESYLDFPIGDKLSILVSSMENMNFSLSKFAWLGQTRETHVNCASLLFRSDDHKIVSVKIYQSTNELAASNYFINYISEIFAGGLPPTNATYQTDFTVLSDFDCGVVTKHAFVILLSTNLVSEIGTSFNDGDSSQDMIQVIKKVETMRDAMKMEPQQKE